VEKRRVCGSPARALRQRPKLDAWQTRIKTGVSFGGGGISGLTTGAGPFPVQMQVREFVGKPMSYAWRGGPWTISKKSSATGRVCRPGGDANSFTPAKLTRKGASCGSEFP